MHTLIKVELIGFGRMGRFYLEEMQKSGRWEVAYICDTDPRSRELAKKLSPHSKVVQDEQEILNDETVQVVGLFALANSRKEQIDRAIQSGKHIISENPLPILSKENGKLYKLPRTRPSFLPLTSTFAIPGIITT